MKDQSLRVLIIEDSEDDALLLIRELQKGRYNPLYERVETPAAMKKSLKEKQWDIILCDYTLPAFTAPSAIAVLKEANVDVPIIIVSGTMGEENAIDCMRSGARDYILKRNMSRLCPAIARELAQAEVSNKQKKAEEARRASEDRYRKITKCSPDLIWTMDFSGQFTYANEAVERTHGWTVDEFLKLNTRDVVSPHQFAKNATLIEKELMKATFSQYDRNAIFSYESEEIRKDGSTFWAEINAMSLWSEDGKPIGIIGITRDISERKKAEKLLAQSEERYRLLAEHTKDQVWLLDFDLNVLYISPSVEKVLGRTLAEIQEIKLDKILTPASFKTAMDFFAIEMPKSLAAPLDYTLNRSLELEFRCKGGHTIWGEIMFSFIRDDEGEPVSLLCEGRDVTERRKAEMKLQQTLDSLKRATGTTIQVLVSALEVKDPYTAGHQSRSAHLACAIAREMGLTEDKIEGISMAGTIHDIGKLSIPAEILTKPVKLSEIEFSLVQEHSRSGYEMLKEVESPWALAEIVYQHHERMNGTGYPRNLKGNEIILEARILAVADVVEAIASHRPYRASLGLEVALNEIEKNRGILYDEAVTDACLKLFREKGYQLE
ncbi:MAG: PAS domain S-box protein [Smithella sp.]|jgi:PAS domain S-box-containing protein